MNVKQLPRSVRLMRAVLGLGLTVGAPAAFAFPATLMVGLHLRAGPSIAYPSVTIMPPGAVVEVYGCEEGYNWCDVQFGADRGWVDAAYLQAQSVSGPVIVQSSAVVLGVTVVPFVFNTYWSNYYVARPWYGRRDFYVNYWNRYPHGVPPPIYRPRPPPPVFRPPPVRPPPPRPGARPPGASRPPGGRPPSGGRPAGGGKPPPDKRPRPTTRPALRPGQ